MIIRRARKEDAAAMLAIYAPYVEQTAITFEYEVPSLEEFQRRLERVTSSYPWLVAVDDGRIVGYAYASRFHERAAYQWSVEVSVYVAMDHRRKGIGRLLYDALEDALRLQGILNLNACIASPVQPDEYLTHDSELFHQRLGYSKVAHFHLCGKKFNRWYDMIWMEKLIGEHL